MELGSALSSAVCSDAGGGPGGGGAGGSSPGEGNAAGDGNSLGAGAPSCGGGRFGCAVLVRVAHVATCGWSRPGSKFKLLIRAMSCCNSDRCFAKNGGDPWWRGGPFSGILAQIHAMALGGCLVAALAIVAFSSSRSSKRLSCAFRQRIVSAAGSIGATED